MRRRHFLTILAGLTVAGSAGGCSGSTSSTPGSAVQPTASSDVAFPAAVTHRYDTTTVARPPERIVTLGQTDHDAVVALESTPIAVAGFVGGGYSPLRPWNKHAFATDPPVLNMLEIEFEKLAGMGPDLILAVMSGVTKSDYAKLSAIAPTVAQPVDHQDWAVPLRLHTELIGAALGRLDRAGALVADLEGAFAALAGREYNAPLSSERVDLLDALDVVVWTTEQDATQRLLDNKLVRNLRTTREGRYLLASNGGNDDLLYSMDWGSILSHRWALENALPRLLRAEDGDPTTDPNT